MSVDEVCSLSVRAIGNKICMLEMFALMWWVSGVVCVVKPAMSGLLRASLTANDMRWGVSSTGI